MKEIARHILDHALRESSISQAFARQVHSERGVLRVCEDLYDLSAYGRVFVISIGKAAHTMLTALHEQAGERFEGIVASSVEPKRESASKASLPVPSNPSFTSAAFAIFTADIPCRMRSPSALPVPC